MTFVLQIKTNRSSAKTTVSLIERGACALEGCSPNALNPIARRKLAKRSMALGGVVIESKTFRAADTEAIEAYADTLRPRTALTVTPTRKVNNRHSSKSIGD